MVRLVGAFLCALIFSFPSLAHACDTGVSSAPCATTPLRTLVVDSAGSGDYVTLQAAIDVLRPGDKLRIKKNVGGYGASGSASCGATFLCLNASGTQANPIQIESYDTNNKALITRDLWVGNGLSPSSTGQWVIIDSVEFSSANAQGSGARLFADHVSFRNNYSHDNLYQGIWQDGANQLIELNTFSHNGDQGNGIGCMGDWDANGTTIWDPAHCHGIYGGVVYPVNPTNCVTPHNVTIRRNWFTSNGGSAYQLFINAGLCQDPSWGRKAHDYLIENNVAEDNMIGFLLVGMAQSTVRNNTVTTRTYPPQNTINSIGFLDWYDTPSSLSVYNNFTYTLQGAGKFHLTDQQFSDRNIAINYNYHFVKSDTPFRGDFGAGFLGYNMLTQWKSISGKDPNGFVVNVDTTSAGLVSVGTGDYHLTSGSPLINVGDPANCPATDYDGNPRSNRCDIGAFEFGSISAPAAPTGLTASAGDQQLSLNWTAASGATSYAIYRGLTSGGPYSQIATATTTSYINTGLNNGTVYYYVVRATNGAGTSPASIEANGTPISGTYYYVATTGADSNSCGQAQNPNTPRRTIAAAFTCLGTASGAGAGHIVQVAAGTYTEELTAIPGGTSWSFPFTLQAASGATVWLKPNGGATRCAYFNSPNATYIIFDHINCDGTNVSAEGYGVTASSPYIRFTALEIKFAKQGILSQSTGNEFLSLTVHNNGTTTFHHGLYIQGASAIVDHCLIYSNAGFGVYFYRSGGGGIVRFSTIYSNGTVGAAMIGLNFNGGANNKAYNNLVYQNANGIRIENGSAALIANNTLYSNTGYCITIAGDMSSGIVKNNICWSNGSGVTDAGSLTALAANLTSDPVFVNPGSDFHLQSTSPAIDTAVTLTDVTTDFDGTTRPHGAAPDIGAYESLSTPGGGGSPLPT